MRGGTAPAYALSLLLASALVAAACQRAPAPARRRAAPSPPKVELTLCERPARPSPAAEDAEVEASFRAFAKEWLEKRRKRGVKDRSFEIRDDFEIALRQTGNEKAPYVGTLRYCEHELRCPDEARASCVLSRRSVVTEIFRLEEGEWQY